LARRSRPSKRSLNKEERASPGRQAGSCRRSSEQKYVQLRIGLPGGFLFVTSGLILAAQTESQLAGVVSRQVAHVAARHASRISKRSVIVKMLYLYDALFVQDDWKATARLTINAGLRWDYQVPPTERNDRLTVGFDPASPSSFRVPGLDLKGGLLFAGVDGSPRYPYKRDVNNVQPRVGLAYQLHDRVVLRGNLGPIVSPLTGSGEEGINQTGSAGEPA
jgi:hypothetical protein